MLGTRKNHKRMGRGGITFHQKISRADRTGGPLSAIKYRKPIGWEEGLAVVHKISQTDRPMAGGMGIAFSQKEIVS